MSMSFFRWLLLSMAVLIWTGCSSDGQEEVEEPAEGASEEGEAAEPANAEGEEAANEAVNEAAPTADEEAAAAKPETPAPAAEPAGFSGKSAPRYITSFALNVRSGPSKDAPVLRHVKWGDKVDVVINGEWAKLAPGEYISSKHLSTTPPGANKGGKAAKAKKGK